MAGMALGPLGLPRCTEKGNLELNNPLLIYVVAVFSDKSMIIIIINILTIKLMSAAMQGHGAACFHGHIVYSPNVFYGIRHRVNGVLILYTS